MVGLSDCLRVKGATMADKSQGRTPKKPAMTIKERRAAKRDKAAESGEIVPRRKRPDRV
jgi:hypothetical protein